LVRDLSDRQVEADAADFAESAPEVDITLYAARIR